jgi:hypothetical protein
MGGRDKLRVAMHRAITLLIMIILSITLLAVMLASRVGSLGGGGLIALGVACGGAILAGAAFSWRRYFPRR